MPHNDFNDSKDVLGGKKSELIARLKKFKKAELQPETVAERLHVFMGDAKQLQGEDRPVITAHYRSSFNATDRFDTYLGHIPTHRRVNDIHHLILLGVIRMTCVNTYSFEQTLAAVKDIDPVVGIKAFVKRIVPFVWDLK